MSRIELAEEVIQTLLPAMKRTTETTGEQISISECDGFGSNAQSSEKRERCETGSITLVSSKSDLTKLLKPFSDSSNNVLSKVVLPKTNLITREEKSKSPESKKCERKANPSRVQIKVSAKMIK